MCLPKKKCQRLIYMWLYMNDITILKIKERAPNASEASFAKTVINPVFAQKGHKKAKK